MSRSATGMNGLHGSDAAEARQRGVFLGASSPVLGKVHHPLAAVHADATANTVGVDREHGAVDVTEDTVAEGRP